MANLVYCDDKNCLTNNYYFALSTTPASNPTQLPPSHTGIADSGASGFSFAPGAPVSNLDHTAPTVGVRVANGLPERSVASATLASAPSLPPAAMQGHVMPTFPHTLIGLGPFADLGCKIVFTKTAVSVIHPDGHSILEGWRELDGPRLWRFPLNATKPSLSVPALHENYEAPGPRGSAADFSNHLSPTQLRVLLVPACLLQFPRWLHLGSILSTASSRLTRLARPARSPTCTALPRPWH